MVAMTYIVTTNSLDDDPEETVHATFDEAVEYARKWFVDGYEDLVKGDPDQFIPLVEEAVEVLVENLRAGREYRCSMFFEHVTIQKAA